MENVIRLPKRLSAIAGFIDAGASVADIGTDHGYLPVYLAQTGQARYIIASDISPGSLAGAQRNAEKYSVTDKIKFICAPGLDGIVPADIDTIIIAGIGGENIRGILKNAPWTVDACTGGNLKLILQPQTKLDVLCTFMHGGGYKITNEATVTDRKRNYTIITT